MEAKEFYFLEPREKGLEVCCDVMAHRLYYFSILFRVASGTGNLWHL